MAFIDKKPTKIDRSGVIILFVALITRVIAGVVRFIRLLPQ